MNYLKSFFFSIMMIPCKDPLAAYETDTENCLLTAYKKTLLSVITMEKQFSKIPLKNFNTSYAKVDQQTHLTPDDKKLIKTIMARTFKNRVKNTVNMRALNDKIMMFQCLSASFSKNPVFQIHNNDFQ